MGGRRKQVSFLLKLTNLEEGCGKTIHIVNNIEKQNLLILL
jgi:hypothetical protein